MAKRVALVLSGGGAKGAFQVGVLKSLEKVGVKPDIIYGTSIGAVNAVGYAGAGIDDLTTMWTDIEKFSHIASFNWSSLWGGSTGFYNLNPTKKRLKAILKDELSCEVVVCKVELGSGLVKYARSTEDNFVNSVIASGSIPVVFEAVDGCVDGGLREKTPLKKAIKEGATDIHVVLTSPILNYPKCNSVGECSTSIIKVAMRSIDIMEHEVFLNDIEKLLEYNKKPNKKTINLFVYAPVKELMGPFDFNKEDIKAAMKQGYNVVDQVRWLR